MNNATTFKFNTINNFELTGQEDKFGIFYAGDNENRIGDTLMRFHARIAEDSSDGAYELRDGRIYEDELSTVMLATEVTNTKTIKNNIASIIKTGGIAADANVIGSTEMDFTYIVYGESQANTSQISAYVYAARYAGSDVVGDTAVNDALLDVAAIAEITNVTRNEIDGTQSDYYLRSKPEELS